MTTTAADELAACVASVADLHTRHGEAQARVKDRERQVGELRATRARATADGQAVPDRAALTALEAELRDAQDLVNELGERLATAEQDHRRLQRDAWRERAAALRAEASEVQAELTRTSADRAAMQRRETDLGSKITNLLTEGQSLEARANAPGNGRA